MTSCLCCVGGVLGGPFGSLLELVGVGLSWGLAGLGEVEL